jgi:hypothetical protein
LLLLALSLDSFFQCCFLPGDGVEARQGDLEVEVLGVEALEEVALEVEVLEAGGEALAAAGVQEAGRMKRNNNSRGPWQ